MEQRLELGFDALTGALARIDEMPPSERFAPLAEALLWVCILNDAFYSEDEEQGTGYKDSRDQDTHGSTLEGLRYARHRLVHDIRVYGMHGAISQSNTLGTAALGLSPLGGGSTMSWRWRDVAQLDPAHDRSGEPVYRERLEGREVGPTLQAAFDFLEAWHRKR